VGGYDDGGLIWPDGFEDLVRCRDDEIAAEHEVGIGDADANGVNLVSRARHAHVTGHRAALLRETRHVDAAEPLAFDVGSLAENGADGDDTRATDARDEHGIRPV